MRPMTIAITALAATTAFAGLPSPVGAAAPSALPLPAAVASAPGSGQSVVAWNRELITILGTPGLQPATIHPTRSFAILQAAEYDAVASSTHAERPYLFSVPAPLDARPDAAADQAAHDVLAALYPAAQSEVDGQLAGELAAIPDGPGKRAGIDVGVSVANLLVSVRAFDGSAATPPPFTAGTQPGDYRPTPPKFPAPVFTGWGKVAPFVITSGDEFRPPAPPAVSSPSYAAALEQVKSLGQDSSTTRTPDQTLEAKFWGSAPIWNTWNEVTQRLLTSQNANLRRATTVFAGLDLTLADTTIALYDAKYTYLVWRPVTAIRESNTGYNPAIPADPQAPNWNPLAITAADPSYPGAHSTISEAAATVLADFFGDRRPVSVASDAMPGVTRNFDDVQAAADEAGLSRIFAGQHTVIDHIAGQQLGRAVATFVLDQLQLRLGHLR